MDIHTADGGVIKDDEAVEIATHALIQLGNHPGWGILMGQLKADAEEAKTNLVDVDALDAQAVMKLQNTVKAYEWFEGTREQLIQNGIDLEKIQRAEAEEAPYGD